MNDLALVGGLRCRPAALPRDRAQRIDADQRGVRIKPGVNETAPGDGRGASDVVVGIEALSRSRQVDEGANPVIHEQVALSDEHDVVAGRRVGLSAAGYFRRVLATIRRRGLGACQQILVRLDRARQDLEFDIA